MLITLSLLALGAADMQPITSFERPEPPRREARQEEDARNQSSEGERSGDGANPDRLICEWRREPGSNFRRRVCQTVADRRAARDIARETIQQMQGSVTDPVG